MLPFSAPTVQWFTRVHGAPTAVQARAWPLLASASPSHALLVAPTGSGKTLAAFLAAIDRVANRAVDAPGVRVLYVSPLKALVHDIEKNLRAPLAGIQAEAAAMGHPLRPVNVDMRTGDTSQGDRRRFARAPAEILVTTPESLYLILGSAARASLRSVETVIIDEVHAIADTKRGVHLAMSLERLEELVDRPFQRVGLSATVRPVEEVASFLTGGRPVEIIDTHAPPRLRLAVEAYLADAPEPAESAANPAGFALDRGAGWPATHSRILELVRAARSTIVFVNSRRLCERIAQRLNELAGEDLARAHHGSVAREQRLVIEDGLKSGRLRAIVATGTLELGIDMGAVDQVLLVESPGSVARGLQRVGRAGHHVGGTSIATIFPRYRADLLETAVVARAMREGDLEAIQPPTNCLDVLAQQVVAIVADGERTVDDLYALSRKAWPMRALPRQAFERTVDMLAGRYVSGPLADLAPRVVWDRTRNVISARKGSATVGRLNAGTIPDRGMYGVFLGKGGPRVGELDEEMVFESARGDTFLLGASTWKIEEITRDQVLVSPAPGEPGRMPFWRSEWEGRPIELGRKVGALARELTGAGPEAAMARLEAEHAFTPAAARQLWGILQEQLAATGTLPTDLAITVERYPDESGDTRVCVLTPFGAKVHAPWAVAIEALLGRKTGAPVKTEHGEDGITLRLAAGDQSSARELLLPDPDEIEDLLLERLADSAVFSARFRENAARALLLPRQRPGKRTPLWQQRIRSQNLLATVRAWPDFPILVETWRECLHDLFDLTGLADVLRAIAAGTIRVDEVETKSPSPFARSMSYRWLTTWLYELDGPAAERKAQVLSLDRTMLDSLIGRPSWSELLDAETLLSVEAELQATAPGWQARDADTLHDLLRRVGDLTAGEASLRFDGTPEELAGGFATLETSGRARVVRVGGEARWTAREDDVLYAPGLGVDIRDVSAAVEPIADPFTHLVRRFGRTHGPFRTEAIAARWGLPAGLVLPVLNKLREDAVLTRAPFRAGGPDEWCDAEVLKRLKRRALERARGDAAALPAAAFARFLPVWQGVGRGGASGGAAGQVEPRQRLLEALDRLEGCPVPFGELEQRILPARVPGYRPALLDELGATGEIAWAGFRPLGDTDGRIALYRRDRLALWREPPPPAEGITPLAARVELLLAGRGASFLMELQGALPGVPREDVVEALWELVWAGRVTNDTFTPLRARAGASRRGAGLVTGGRWGLLARLVEGLGDTTSRALTRAEGLLRRYGVLPLRAAMVEELPGAGAAIYPALRAMEEAGRARRGLFVDGVGGVQFAVPGAVEALRNGPRGETVVLAATEPANPYGALIDWPLTGARRVAGARVVLHDGELAVFIERGGRSALLMPLDPTHLVAALGALRSDAIRSRDRDLRVERIDGAPALTSPAATLFLQAGFQKELGGRGLVVPP